MKNKLLFYCFLNFVSLCVFTQNDLKNDSAKIAKNTFYFEFGGNGGDYSLNFDRILFVHKNIKLAGTIGFSQNLNTSGNGGRYSIFPTELNFLFGKNHHLEFNFAYSFSFYFINTKFLKGQEFSPTSPLIRVGYRFQQKNGGSFVRLGISLPILPYKYFNNFQPNYGLWYGIALGYTLKKK